jgi:hypothetical protein
VEALEKVVEERAAAAASATVEEQRRYKPANSHFKSFLRRRDSTSTAPGTIGRDIAISPKKETPKPSAAPAEIQIEVEGEHDNEQEEQLPNTIPDKI